MKYAFTSRGLVLQSDTVQVVPPGTPRYDLLKLLYEDQGRDAFESALANVAQGATVEAGRLTEYQVPARPIHLQAGNVLDVAGFTVAYRDEHPLPEGHLYWRRGSVVFSRPAWAMDCPNAGASRPTGIITSDGLIAIPNAACQSCKHRLRGVLGGCSDVASKDAALPIMGPEMGRWDVAWFERDTQIPVPAPDPA